MAYINKQDTKQNIKDWTVAIIFGVFFGVMYAYALFGIYF